jgi:hypothetical protein
MRLIRSSVLLALTLATLAGCRAVREEYYKSLEKIGIEKRELLVSRVGKAAEAQSDAQKQFKDALEEFQALVGYRGGDLEAMYSKLSGEFEKSQKRAEEVHERIRKVREVAQSLFAEWQREIGQFENADYRRESEQQLRETRQRYDQLVVVMEKAAKAMDPVLVKLRDQVLYLKHNLNARALGSLRTTADTLQKDVSQLIAEMQSSIAEADRFIADMKKK